MRSPVVLLSLVLPLALAACGVDAPTMTAAEQNGQCEGDECPEDPLPPCDACDGTSGCTAECRDSDGHSSTCAEAGYCQSCDACGPDVPCHADCVTDSGSVTTCGTQKPLCQKFDVYCALPLITAASISDNKEPGSWAWPMGPEAFLYFRSAGGEKNGNYPREVGGLQFDPDKVWASNFRGPHLVSETREQWEWTGASTSNHDYPFRYGHATRCEVVPAGSPRPILASHTEQVYEDDECYGCDDHVGGFTLERSFCEGDVFRGGNQTGWSAVHAAPVTGHISRVNYKLWCYSCLGSNNESCSAGVVW